MKVYSYDKETGELKESVIAEVNPLEKGKFLIPAFSTEQEPPKTGLNEVAVFENGAWVVKPDFRGQYWSADGEQIQIEEIGVLKPVGALNEMPQPTSEQVRKSEIINRLAEIDNASIRPLRAISAGTAVQFDHDKLNALEAERAALVEELNGLMSNG